LQIESEPQNEVKEQKSKVSKKKEILQSKRKQKVDKSPFSKSFCPKSINTSNFSPKQKKKKKQF